MISSTHIRKKQCYSLAVAVLGLTSILGLQSCGGSSGSSTEPDVEAPTATITFPTAVSLTEGASVTVHGTSSDASIITSVTVNDISAVTTDNYLTWKVSVPLVSGENSLRVKTTDEHSNANNLAAQAVVTRGLTADNFPDSVTPLSTPVKLVLDSDNNRVLIADRLLDAIVAVDLNTGVRTIISDSTTPDANNRLIEPSGIILDKVNNRALVAEANSSSILAVDLASGARTVISSNTLPDSTNPFGAMTGISQDVDNNHILVLDYLTIFRVALDNGARTIISSNATPSSGDVFEGPFNLVLDKTNNQVFVADYDKNAILNVNLTTGLRSIVSDLTFPNASNYFYNPSDLILDNDINRLLVVDNDLSTPAIISVHPETGIRTVLSNSSYPDTVNALIVPHGIVKDSLNNRLYVTDEDLQALVVIEATTGERVILSK